MLYNAQRRGIEWDLLPWLRERRVPVMAYSPLDQGRLLGTAPIRKLAGDVGCTPAQLALAWVMNQGADVVPIPGTTKVTRLAENAAAADITLTPEELAKLGRDHKLIPGMPAEDFIETTPRSIMSYVVKPLVDLISHLGRDG